MPITTIYLSIQSILGCPGQRRDLGRLRQLEELIRRPPSVNAEANSTVLYNPVTQPLKSAADFRRLINFLLEEEFRKEFVRNTQDHQAHSDDGSEKVFEKSVKI
ncbi:unnamed protein product [Dibothriocephalus latus]|uniref:Uncharacterized protein n=1 Tax=Dibothriocephalus latus TaxID=60516 RepID=A0A3P6RYQ6_DIBLA|nr:unnamed protein product [Dibothriocephalus latus]